MTTKALDPMAYTDSGTEEIPWASPAAHVAAYNTVAKNATSPEDLANLAEMLGFSTKQMRDRYQRGLEAT